MLPCRPSDPAWLAVGGKDFVLPRLHPTALDRRTVAQIVPVLLRGTCWIGLKAEAVHREYTFICVDISMIIRSIVIPFVTGLHTLVPVSVMQIAALTFWLCSVSVVSLKWLLRCQEVVRSLPF